MSVQNGPGEGTWSVFAMKVSEERDAARAEVDRLQRLLKMAEDEAVEADNHGRAQSKRADHLEAESERALAAEERLEQMTRERDEAVHACAAALAERITWYQRGREEALKDKP